MYKQFDYCSMFNLMENNTEYFYTMKIEMGSPVETKNPLDILYQSSRKLSSVEHMQTS